MDKSSKTSNDIKCLPFLLYLLFLSTMIKLSQNQYYKIIILAILIDFSTTYKMYSVDDHRLCSPITKRKIKLGSDAQSGLIVSLGRLEDHSLDWEKNFVCKFQVVTSNSNHGLFVVIQSIVFRKNESADDCIDYVQLKRHDGSSSKKYCGPLNAALGMDPIFAPDVYVSTLAPTVNSFIDPTGQLDVYIYVSREPLHTYEEMELQIVFTSYRRCVHALKDDQQCNDKMHKDYCIYRGFFDDDYVNCPFPDCVDEKGCSEKIPGVEKKSVGNKVIIGSVTLLLVVFVFFICFVWLCRKYKKLCWAEEFASGSSLNQSSRTIELSEPSSRSTSMPSTGASLASAPAGGSTDEDKDLPPSYDSLFPVR